MKVCKINRTVFVFSLVIGIFIIFNANLAISADFCVSDEAGFNAALTTAASNGEDDIIKIQQGTYNGNFIYSTETEAFGVIIEGGYTAGCLSRVVDATNTVLDAQGNGPVLFLRSTIVSASFSVEGLTLQNGNGTNIGGGLYIGTNVGMAIIDNCSIYNNTHSGLYISAAKMTISNSNISYNNGPEGGGGMVLGGEFTINNTTVTHNNGSKGGGLYILNSKVVLADNVISSNTGGYGGGVYIENGSASLEGNDINHNEAQYNGGGINIQGASDVVMLNNSVTYNRSILIGSGYGGGVAIRGVPTVTITDNNISYNSNGNDGGGIFILEFSKCTLNNNVIDHNIGGAGAGAFIEEWGSSAAFSEADLINNTFCLNVTNGNSLRGGGIFVGLVADTSIANIYNNIIFNNDASYGDDLYLENDRNGNYLPSIVNLFNNNFDQSSTGTYIQVPFPIDPSNLNNEDPLFVDSSNGNYRLTDVSPCIDAGNNSAPELPTTDKDGNPRIIGTAVDIGAYEYQGFVTPVAAFKGDPVRGIAPLAVQFTDLSSGSVETWEWNFGDGPSSTQRNPLHAYNNPGIYTVTLTVSGDSVVDVEEKTNYITVISPGAPDLVGKIKDFHAMQYCKNVSLSLQVENLGSEDACNFNVDLYHSPDGYTLGELVDERTVTNCVKGGTSHNIGLRYFSENELSGEHLIYFIDSGNNVREINELNNKSSFKVPK